jgi:hypothetical protein
MTPGCGPCRMGVATGVRGFFERTTVADLVHGRADD